MQCMAITVGGHSKRCGLQLAYPGTAEGSPSSMMSTSTFADSARSAASALAGLMQTDLLCQLFVPWRTRGCDPSACGHCFMQPHVMLLWGRTPAWPVSPRLLGPLWTSAAVIDLTKRLVSMLTVSCSSNTIQVLQHLKVPKLCPLYHADLSTDCQ